MNTERCLERADWAALIPHQGSMCLLDRVMDWDDERLHAQTDSHRSADNPLRSDDQLRALHLCEYGAQAMAVHGALLARASGAAAAPGYLVSLRAIRLEVARVDQMTGSLDVHAERLMGGEGSWQYQFRIEHAGQLLASGRAAVMLR